MGKNSIRPMADKTQKSKLKSQKEKSLKSSKTTQKKRAPATMAELLTKTGYKIHGFKKGELVEGNIVSISRKEILIDIGGKTEGTVARKELPFLKDLLSSFKIGEKVITRVLLPEGERGQPLLSLKEATAQRKWNALKEKAEKEEEIEVLAKRLTRGGILVECQNLRGFIPQSQLDPKFFSEQKSLLGRKLKVKILEVDQSLNRLVLSQKAVTQKDRMEKIRKLLRRIKVGQVLEAEITGIVPFGLFCQVKGMEGLIHISEISWERVENPGDFLKVGDKVKVKVLGIEEKGGKLNLSIKQLTADPWKDIEKRYKKEQIIKGKVVRLSPFGAFVNLEKGIEGLIHISKIPAGVEFKKGEEVECVIEEIEKEARKMSLNFLPKEIPVGYR